MSYNPNSQYSGSSQTYNSRKELPEESGFFKFILIAGAILGFVFLIRGIVNGALSKGDTDIAAVVQNYVIPAEECYHYSQLDEYGQHIYREILTQAPSGTANFTVSDVTKSDFDDHYSDAIESAVDAIELDHPEFFWINNRYSATYTPVNDTISLTIYPYDFWKKST